jgi:hypothetical protein
MSWIREIHARLNTVFAQTSETSLKAATEDIQDLRQFLRNELTGGIRRLHGGLG